MGQKKLFLTAGIACALILAVLFSGCTMTDLWQCGNKICEDNETCVTCPNDCKICYVNGVPTESGTIGTVNSEKALASSSQCTDTDGGRSYYKLGYVTGACADCDAKGIISGNTDTCIMQNSAGMTVPAQSSQDLVEFYCTTTGWKRETTHCLKGCSAGVCIQ